MVAIDGTGTSSSANPNAQHPDIARLEREWQFRKKKMWGTIRMIAWILFAVFTLTALPAALLLGAAVHSVVPILIVLGIIGVCVWRFVVNYRNN
ncbi:MAG: hypothetical protein PHS95_00895 [Candidatus Pacebacteria bacterium]|nr:hypothetical protein [Candidatus Paceibacterota bacterium]